MTDDFEKFMSPDYHKIGVSGSKIGRSRALHTSSKDRMDQVVDVVEAMISVKPVDLAHILGVSPRTLTGYIPRLIEDGRIVRLRRDKSSFLELPDKQG